MSDTEAEAKIEALADKFRELAKAIKEATAKPEPYVSGPPTDGEGK